MFPPRLFKHKIKLYAGNRLRIINDYNKFKEINTPGFIAYGICFNGQGINNKIYPYLDNNAYFLYGNPFDSTSVLPDFERLNKINGNYVLVMKKGDKLLISKDKIGTKQVYYGENSAIAAFATRKNSLRDVDIDPIRLRPGETVKFSLDGIKKVGIKDLKKPNINIHKEKTAAERYKTVLFSAVKKRVKNINDIGIIFSSGIDSTLIAKIASMQNLKVICFIAGVTGSPDTNNAELYAKELGLRLVINKLNMRSIEKLLPKVINVIENWNQYQVEAAIPVYFAMETAAKDGLKVVMTGQLADELFAGYDWYPRVLQLQGKMELSKRMWQDISFGYKEILERENKIAEFFDLDLRVPYCDEKVIKTAMKISVDLKTKEEDVMGKYIHRKVSEDLGIPLAIAWREKEEIQDGSGVHEVIENLAVNQGYDPDKKYAFETKIEKLGSVYRYGNKYRPLKERFGSKNVQKYFEDIAIDLEIAS
jgi:asparagine synthase (glutamine-hydrolysing)